MTTSLSTRPCSRSTARHRWRLVTTENRFGGAQSADGEVIARVADGGAELAGEAIDAAARALPDWRAPATTAAGRCAAGSS